jgi:hypothetical protein
MSRAREDDGDSESNEDTWAGKEKMGSQQSLAEDGLKEELTKKNSIHAVLLSSVNGALSDQELQIEQKENEHHKQSVLFNK